MSSFVSCGLVLKVKADNDKIVMARADEEPGEDMNLFLIDVSLHEVQFHEACADLSVFATPGDNGDADRFSDDERNIMMKEIDGFVKASAQCCIVCLRAPHF